MFVACMLLLIALLASLPSTDMAQTLDHQQLHIAGAFETNSADPANFGGKHLLKHEINSAEDTVMLDD